MIDHLIRFDSEEQARADAVVGAYFHANKEHPDGGSWDGARVIPDVKVWQPANDTTEDIEGPGGETVTVTRHTYLPYIYKLISLPEVDPALRDHPTCMLVADRDKAAAGDPSFIVYTPIPSGQLGSYALEPTFAGSHYPFGQIGD